METEANSIQGIQGVSENIPVNVPVKNSRNIKCIDIKDQLTRDDVRSILVNYGHEVSTKDYKFRLRDEKTPSAVINQDGTIHDYGADYHGDIVDVLQEFHNLNFIDALEVLKVYIGATSTATATPRATIAHVKVHSSTLSEQRYKQIVKTMQWYDGSERQYQTFKFDKFRDEALAIVPMWVWKEATADAINRFKSVTTYDHKNHTLVIKIHDYQGELISYKRRRLGGGKWITAKDTHPNNQCLINDTRTDTPIYIVEGHHDYLTAILLGLNVIMLPTVNYTVFKQYELMFLKGRDVIFLPDIGDANKSIDGMRKLAEQLDKWSNDNNIVSLEKFLEYESINNDNNKLDLSEIVEVWMGGVDALVSALHCFSDRGSNFFSNEMEIF